MSFVYWNKISCWKASSVQYLLCLSHLMSRQRLQRGNDVALLWNLPVVLSKQSLQGPLVSHGAGLSRQVRRDVHDRLSVLRLLFGVSHLCDDTRVHFLHPHVQNAIDPGQLRVFGFTELQRTDQRVLQSDLQRHLQLHQSVNISEDWTLRNVKVKMIS